MFGDWGLDPSPPPPRNAKILALRGGGKPADSTPPVMPNRRNPSISPPRNAKLLSPVDSPSP